MDFQKLVSRFRQFGGMRLVCQYAQLGALWPAVKAGVRCLVKGQSFKAIYPEVLKKVEPFLVERYKPLVSGFKFQVSSEGANTNSTNNTNEIPHQVRNEEPRTIWWCWLQGLAAAPPIVKACHNSLKQLTGYSLVVIDNTNWREYVELPEYIVEKWEKGRIPAAMFSDLLRVELLIEYGGTWIDSTVLCTGVNYRGMRDAQKFQEKHTENLSNSQLDSDSKLSTLNTQLKQYMNAPLFVFQYTREGSVPVSISNWFITVCRNNEVLMVLREMLYAYWRDYDCVLDYYIFHIFFAMISKEYPEQMAAMPYAQSQRSLVLLHHWGEKYDQKKWDNLTSQVCFHKLAFRVNDHIKKDQENYYNHILSEYGRF